MNNVFKKRIDELGRIVIPKQIRNTFKIKNFDELELSVENDTIVLKKSIGIEMYKDKIERLLNFIRKFNDFEILIIDKQKLIVSTDKNITNNEEFVIDENSFNNDVVIKFKNPINEKTNFISYCLPIIIDSNTLGEIYFINDGKLFTDKNLLKEIRDLIIDLIN